MTYLLDTSIMIDILRNGKSISFIDAHIKDNIITSSVCVFELYSGIYLSHKSQFQSNLKKCNALLDSFTTIVPLEWDQAQRAGELYAILSKHGNRIEDTDLLIASCALLQVATVVTNNLKHFSRIPGLTVLSV